MGVAPVCFRRFANSLRLILLSAGRSYLAGQCPDEHAGGLVELTDHVTADMLRTSRAKKLKIDCQYRAQVQPRVV